MRARLLRLIRPRRGRKRLAIAIISGALVLWTVGLVDFAARIPTDVTDRWTFTDAIVVLTGGSKRVEAGLALLAAGHASRMFVSGVHAEVSAEELIALLPVRTAALGCCVEVGHEARNTRGNALETAAWMRANGFTSLRLVTSSYHMPRSLAEFTRAIPEATIVPHPVFAAGVKTEQWWKWPGTAALIASEYNKMLLTRVRSAVGTLVDETEGTVRTAAR